MMNPLRLWWACLRWPLDAWRNHRHWTPTRKAANGYGLSWDRRPGILPTWGTPKGDAEKVRPAGSQQSP